MYSYWKNSGGGVVESHISKDAFKLHLKNCTRCVNPGRHLFTTFEGTKFVIFHTKPYNLSQVGCHSKISDLMADSSLEDFPYFRTRVSALFFPL